MNITSKAMAKVAVVATTLAMATSMLSLAPIAHAATCTISSNLTVGSTGTQVTCLQGSLIAAGYSLPAGATGYFGMQTKAAVKMWQAAVGLPNTGFFGPMSRAAFNLSTGSTGGSVSTVPGCLPGAMFSSTTGQACTTTTSTVPGCSAGAMFSSTTGQACGSGTVTTGTLTGSGRLTNVTSLGGTTTDIHEGDAVTAVVGVSADATGGDVVIQRVDGTVDLTTSTGSSNPSKYFSEISLWLNGTKIASMDAASGDKTSGTRIWTYRFSGLNGVIKAGTTGNLYVKVTPVSTVDTSEDGQQFTVSLLANSVRAAGADGISDTYVATAINTTGVKVSSATNGTLTVSEAGDNPKASQVAVGSSTTSGVKLLSFNMKAKNQSVKVTDLKVSLNTSDNNLSDVISNLSLMQGSTVISTKSVSTGSNGTVVFSNVNQSIAKDQTQNYTLVADIRGDSAYADGVTVVASTTILGWDVSDANGTTISPSAAVAGNTVTLTAVGISVAKGTPTATVTSASFSGGLDTANYSIPFTVTAGDTDMYVAGAAQNSSGNVANKVTYGTTTTSTQGATTQPTASISVADTVTGDSAGVYYKVLANTSRTFTLNVALTASSSGVTAGYAGIQINSIAYGTVAGTEGTFYTSGLDTYKTNDVYVQKH